MFCKYKNIFGKPNTGAHSYRIANIAIVDVLATVLGAFLISYFYKLQFHTVLIVLFLLGVFLHWLFCVETAFSKLKFLNSGVWFL